MGSVIGLATGWRRWLLPSLSRACSWLRRRTHGEAARPAVLAPVEAPPVTLAPETHRYQRRPVAVASDLGSLRGPVTGTVRLPELLHWSGDENAARFNLDDPRQRPAMYTAVLREARTAAELGEWLNGEWLAGLWPRLVLPPAVRAAWEQQHPVLREARTARELRPAS